MRLKLIRIDQGNILNVVDRAFHRHTGQALSAGVLHFTASVISLQQVKETSKNGNSPNEEQALFCCYVFLGQLLIKCRQDHK